MNRERVLSVPSSDRRYHAVFLDRDGVLNKALLRQGKSYPPSSADELELIPGVTEACVTLWNAGYLLIVVTNQPDVARGTQDKEVVESINRTLWAQLPLHDIRVCYHDDCDNCNCRKPRPGLLLDAAKDWGIDLQSSFMVGDRWKDIDAGRGAGCKTVFVDYGYAENRPKAPDYQVDSLIQAVPWVLKYPLGNSHAAWKG